MHCSFHAACHTHTHTYTHAHTRTHTHTYTRTHIHTHTYTYRHTHTHIHTQHKAKAIAEAVLRDASLGFAARVGVVDEPGEEAPGEGQEQEGGRGARPEECVRLCVCASVCVCV